MLILNGIANLAKIVYYIFMRNIFSAEDVGDFASDSARLVVGGVGGTAVGALVDFAVDRFVELPGVADMGIGWAGAVAGMSLALLVGKPNIDK